MTPERLFERIDGLRVGVLGDFCLDVYWRADMRRSRLSRETPHHPLPIVEERMSLGAAGNVAAGIAALQPAQVTALGVLGRDWRGDCLRPLLKTACIGEEGLVCCESVVTNAYIKPLRAGISEVVYEDPRLDFENDRPLPAQAEARLLARLEALAPGLDLLCVCDQMEYGCITPAVRDKVCALGKAGLMVFVDSRERIGLYDHVILKPNEVEAARALEMAGPIDYEAIAQALSEKTGRPVLLTLGGQGCLVCEGGRATRIPARETPPPIDICGAGDAFLAAAGCAHAAGLPLVEAARFAGLAASIVIQKIGTTGTASRQEIMGIWEDDSQKKG